MSEATQDIHDSNDLDARVNALVGDKASGTPSAPQIDFDTLAADAVAELVTSAQPPTTDASQPQQSAPPGALDEAVEQLISAEVTKDSNGEAAAPSPPLDLAHAVEKLIKEEAPKPQAPAEPPPNKIENLDAKIANLADDLIAGEFADEQNVVQGRVGEPPAKEAPPPPSGTERPAPKAPEATTTEPPAPLAETPRETVQFAPIAPAPVAKAPAPPARPAVPSRRAAEVAAKAAARQSAKAAGRLKPHGIKLLELMNTPLRNKPKPIRDLVGWIAIITLFNASCLWMYVLFFRSATAPEPAANVAVAGHDEVKKDDAAHGEKKPADKSKKPPARKEAAKKGPSKANSGGH